MGSESPSSSGDRSWKSAEEETDTRRMSHQKAAKSWRTEKEQQIYSSKLAEALRRRSLRSSGDTKPKTVPCGAREIRETAYRVLAISARGTTRWSRAILVSRIRASRRMVIKKRIEKLKASKSIQRKSAVEKKVKVLGKLVPGCRKLRFPKLLEETADFIAALEMQVRAMSTLAELLASSPPAPSRP